MIKKIKLLKLVAPTIAKHLASCRVLRRRSTVTAMALGAALVASGPTLAAPFENQNLRLLGHSDLHGRISYWPEIVKQGERWYAYVGLQSGAAVNRDTGVSEENGFAILDVTDPQAPKFMKHVPAPSKGASRYGGGSSTVRVCSGAKLPNADKSKFYLIQEIAGDTTVKGGKHVLWDVSNPSEPKMMTTLTDGLVGTHKNFWDCETGVAYLVSGVPGWRTSQMLQIFDLANPQRPRHIRNFGIAGQEPGAKGEVPSPDGVHGVVVKGNRVYLAWGTFDKGHIQIVDRDKLVTGDPRKKDRFAPTRENLLYPQQSLVKMPSFWGVHTTFPLIGVDVEEYAKFPKARKRDYLAVTSEADGQLCGVPRPTFFFDITEDTAPVGVANYQVSEAEGGFCNVPGRFGAHGTHENMTPVFYNRVLFVTQFNAGVRALDIRNPAKPVEIARFRPEATDTTIPSCNVIDGKRVCEKIHQTNNVNVDDRGYIYITDKNGSGLHILELTGEARKVADYTKAVR